MRYWVYINEQVLERPFLSEELAAIPGFTRETLICPEIVPPGSEQEWVPARMLLEPRIEPPAFTHPAVEEYNPTPVQPVQSYGAEYTPQPVHSTAQYSGENNDVLLSKIDTLMIEVQSLRAQLAELTHNLVVVKSQPVETDPAELSNTSIERHIIEPQQDDIYQSSPIDQAPVSEEEVEDIYQESSSEEGATPFTHDDTPYQQPEVEAAPVQEPALDDINNDLNIEEPPTLSIDSEDNSNPLENMEEIKDMDTLLAGSVNHPESDDFLQDAINTTFSRKKQISPEKDPNEIVDLAKKDTEEVKEEDVPTVEADDEEIHTEKTSVTEIQAEVKEEPSKEEEPAVEEPAAEPQPEEEPVSEPVETEEEKQAKADALKAAYVQVQDQPAEDYYQEEAKEEAPVQEPVEEAVLEETAEAEAPLAEEAAEPVVEEQPAEEPLQAEPIEEEIAPEPQFDEPFEPKTIILDDAEADLSAPMQEEFSDLAKPDYNDNLIQEEPAPAIEPEMQDMTARKKDVVAEEPVYEEPFQAEPTAEETPVEEQQPAEDLSDIPNEVPAAEEVSDEVVSERITAEGDVEAAPETIRTDREDIINLEETDSIEEKSVLDEFAADKKEAEAEAPVEPEVFAEESPAEEPAPEAETPVETQEEDSSAAYIVESSAEPKEAAITTLEELTGTGGPVAEQDGVANAQDAIDDKFLKTFTSSIEEVFLDQPTSIISDYVPPAIAETSDGESPYDPEPVRAEASSGAQLDAMASLMDLKAANPDEVDRSVRKVRRIKPAAIKTVPMVAANGEDINTGAPNIDEAIAELGGNSVMLRFVKMFSAILVLLFILLLFIALLASMGIIPSSWSPAHSMLSKMFKKPAVEEVKKPTAEDILVEDALTEQQQREQLLQKVINTVKSYKLPNGMTLNDKIVAAHPKIADQIQWTADQAVDPSYFSIAAKLPPNQEGYSLTYRFSYNTSDGGLVPTTSEANNIIQSAAAQAVVQAGKQIQQTGK